MRCGKAERLLTPYLDERLGEAERREVDAHLESCAECTKELRLLRGAQAALRVQEAAQPPEGLSARVADAALASGRDEKEARGPSMLEQLTAWRWPAAITAAAAAAAAIVLMINVGLPGRTPAPGANGAGDQVAGMVTTEDAGLDDDDMTAAVLAQEEE